VRDADPVTCGYRITTTL